LGTALDLVLVEDALRGGAARGQKLVQHGTKVDAAAAAVVAVSEPERTKVAAAEISNTIHC
jgi:hypothetical protein